MASRALSNNARNAFSLNKARLLQPGIRRTPRGVPPPGASAGPDVGKFLIGYPLAGQMGAAGNTVVADSEIDRRRLRPFLDLHL